MNNEFIKTERIKVGKIPCIVWGEPSDKVYLCVHGKMSDKESARELAVIAQSKGWQTFSFDLPMHGERIHESERADIFHGIRDLNIIADYVFSHYQKVSLYACSLGAYFSLHAYKNRRIEKCLFQSPIVDMKHLIDKMMVWFDITLERLEKEKEIETPIDLMSWEYYRYVLSHPITEWNIPTHILFGGRDDLQSTEVMNDFAGRFSCNLTVSQDSLHPFIEKGDILVVHKWLSDNL